jgi:hypothetical protein
MCFYRKTELLCHSSQKQPQKGVDANNYIAQVVPKSDFFTMN